MAKYTFELRELFEPIIYDPPVYTRAEVEGFFKDYELEDYLTKEQISVIMNANVWSKERLAKKIVDHYYMRESGLETVAAFRQRAKVKMQELMEEYLPLIYSASISYDPLVNVDVTTTVSRQINDTGSNSSSGLTINSDTPQGQISKTEILSGEYASSTQGGESSTSNTSQSIETSSTNTRGNSGVSATAQKMIEQYRNNIRAIDREIIEKLNPIFMGLY